METYDSSGNASAGVFALFGAMFIPVLIVGVITLIGQWKVFTKAGKPGWACIIPIYNLIVLLEIVGKPIWWIFLFLIPCVNIIFIIWTLNLLSKSFGQSEGFTIGLILLGFIFWPMLGFGNYQYLGPAAAEAGGLGKSPFNPSDYKDPFGNPPQA
jgi:hypothetical protein